MLGMMTVASARLRPTLRMTSFMRAFSCAKACSIKYTERLTEAGLEPSVGSVGDSYDNALAETVIGLYKT
jgi:hypothetical protein